MVLDNSQILAIFKDKPNKVALEYAIKHSNTYTAHITGIGNDALLERVTGLESEKQINLRKQFAKSNKDIFARIHRPEDKIFTAKGGATYFNLSEAQQKDFIATLNNVYKGYSVRGWVEAFALQYYHIDPMGLVFIEVSKEGVAYPTYKGTKDIEDYSLNGRDVNYVIFKTDNKEIFRVVDESGDYLVEFKGGEVIEIPNERYPNYFNKVPALVISDLIAPNTEFFTSPDDIIIDLADEFLREGSVKSIYKLKHGFPKAWQYQSTCNSCNGTGIKGSDNCSTCNGTGMQVVLDTSEVITLPIPTTDQPAIAPNVAGYATPDIQGWDNMTNELTDLENLMHSTYWGIKDRVKAVGVGSEKTATEIIDDMQPLNDRLHKFSKWAESVENFIVDCLGKFYYSESFSCTITYGKRYALESPDAIWTKYETARASGSNTSVLDELLTEYYYSKYDNNSIELNKYLKLMKLEPFIHLSLKEAKDLILNVDDYNRKVYYGQWLNQLNPNELIYKSVEALNQSLTNYIKSKQII